MDTHSGCVFSFSGFVFDPESGELVQNGMRVRLGKQTADILAVLILNAGSLVTRQRLRQLLWPAGELVNHEKIINNGISRLRYIFHDDPLAPTFIERVPKRGYRWIMPVERIERIVPAPPPALAVRTEPEPQEEPSALEARASTTEANTGHLSARDAAPRRHPLRWAALAALVLLAIGAGVWRSRRRPAIVPQAVQAPTPQTISLAVAPLEAYGPGAAELAESFRLDLTDALAQLPQVQVRSAHSVNQLRLTDASLPAYSSKLGLDVILFGAFRRSARGCELQLELVRVRDSVHLASFRYTGSIDQLRNIRDKIQSDTFAKLRLSGNGDRPPAGGTSDPEAYQAYLDARYQFSQQSADSLRLAVKQYTLAIERDRHFAKAYIGLAQTYLILFSHYLIPPHEAFTKAGDAVNQAQRLGDSSAEVHSILGYIRFYRDWDLAGGIDEEQQAIRLEPHQPIYRQWLAVLLCDERRFPEALNEISLAEADDPYWPSLYVTDAYVASNAQDTSRMIGAARKLKELLPDSPIAYDTMANALWYSGHQMEGIAEWRRMALLEHDSERVAMEDRGLEAYRRDGAAGYARVRLAEFSNTEEIKLHPNDFDPEEWYVTAGDTKRALDALRQRVSAHDPAFLEEATTPFFNGIRNDPEFIALLKQAGVAGQLAPGTP
jgi:DNA-binding winged helix-turn-helix (wHTH) protein/TolB-like protein